MNTWTQKNGLLMMHLMVIILGFTGILGKLIDANATLLVWYRTLIAFVSLGVFLFFKRSLLKTASIQLLPILGVGAIVALHWIFFFESIKVSNVSVAVVCLATSSLFSALLEPLFFKRKTSRIELLLGLIVIVALAFAVNAELEHRLGYLYGIIAALLATLFTLFNARLIKNVPATKITFYEMIGGWGILTIYLLFTAPLEISTLAISQQDLLYLLLLGIVCTAFAFVVSIEVMKTISPYSVIMAINLEPIYSIVLALLLFGDSEEMTTSFYIGGSVIILTVFLDAYLKTKAKKKVVK